MKIRRLVFAVVALTFTMAAFTANAQELSPEQKRFDALVAKAQEIGGSLDDGEVTELLELGKRLGSVYQASLAFRGYMRGTPEPSLDIQKLAAENAALVGDYRTAVARYKAYLDKAPDGADAAAVAAATCTMLIQFLNDTNDAYQLMTQYADRFRAHAAVRKFDGWYLNEAKRREDHVNFAHRLALVMQDKLPLHQERLLFWDHIEAFMQGINGGGQEYYNTLTHARKIVPLIREDRPRQLRYQLSVLALEYAVGRIARDTAALRQSYQDVIKAAQLYFDEQPTGATLKDILQVMAGGAERDFDRILWQEHADLKQSFMLANFPKVPPEQRHELLAWRNEGKPVHNQLLTPVQWGRLIAQIGPSFFSHPVTWDIELVGESGDLAYYQALAKATQGVPSPAAAVVNAIAAANGDPALAAQHLVDNASWHLDFQQIFALVKESLIPACAEIKGDVPEDFVEQVLVAFGPKGIAGTPIALFDPDAAAAWLLAAFSNSSADPFDKSKVAAHLHALDWVAYDEATRQRVFKPAYEAFTRWSNLARREKKDDPAVTQMITTLESEFQATSSGKSFAPEKAPDELSRQLAAAMTAIQDENAEAFLELARPLYAQVSRFEQTKAPFGYATARFLAAWNRPFDVTAWQQEIIADQLAAYDPAKPTWPMTRILGTFVQDRPTWNGWLAPVKERATAEAYNQSFADGIAAQIDRGHFWGWAFDRLRDTRKGSGWNEEKLGTDLAAKLIESKILIGSGYRPNPAVRSDTGAYMFLVDQEFRSLAKDYPLESYFDDMFVAEAEKSGYLDSYYFNRGRDQKRKIADAAARLITAMDALPFGYGAKNGDVVYPPLEFWRWQDHAMNANDQPRRAMLAKLDTLFGSTRYDTYAMGRGYFRTEADVASPQGRSDYFARLTTYIDRAGQISIAVAPPRLNQLRRLGPAKDITVAETDVLIRLVRECAPLSWWRGWEFEELPAIIYQSLVAQDRAQLLYPLIPHFWTITRDLADDRYKRAVADLSTDLMEREKYDLVAVHSQAGTQILGNAMPDEVKDSLMSMRSKALSRIGGAVAVARTDPRFPIYQAQADFLAGNYQSAWEGYQNNAARIPGILKELDTQFTIWLIQRNTQLRDFDAANGISRLMIQWMDNSPVTFDKETRAQLLLTYADISFAMEEFPRARAQYERIAAAKEFNGTRAQLDANLKIAEVDRLTKQYDQAAERLEKLLRLKTNYVQLGANFLLAKLKFDQEEYQGAKEFLEQVFMRDPNHYEARILEGEVNLRMKRLMEATQLRVGLLSSQRNIMPGKPLEVSLDDQNLSIVGSTRSIEIRAWTESGDEETFSLLPFGETKTKFQGQLPTALNVAVKNDNILQLLGNDRIFYEFSPAFRKRHGIAEAEPSSLNVATDAELYVSSGEILTGEQIEERNLEMMIRRQLRLEGATDDPANDLRDRRRGDQVKPGNFVYVRVVDPDRSTSTANDKINVRVETSSGDVIPRFTLEETEPHSGIFEGQITTGSAQATAYASDSREGVDPNFVISSGDYPAWMGLADNQRPKTFSIDLNDNVQMKSLTMMTDVPGRQLKSMIVQTSLNARDFHTVGIWPQAPEPWDGSLQAELVEYRTPGIPRTLSEFKEYLEATWYVNGQQKQVKQLESLSIEAGANVFGLDRQLGLGRNQPYLMHIRGAFWVERRQVRVFQLQPKSRYDRNYASFVFAIDGKVGENPLEISRSLSAGLHYLDLYVWSRSGVDLKFDLLCDVPEPPYQAVCPPEMFSLTENPKIAENLPKRQATIDPKNNFSQLDIAFAEGTSARLLRFILVDFSMDAPAIRKIYLLDANGKRMLPTEQDFRKLKENDVLEIVPGDRVTITYNDPKQLTPGNEILEGFLTATYSDATLQACSVQNRLNRYGIREIEYVPLRRFQVGEKVNIYIDEPDADVTDKKDVVKYTAAIGNGKAIELDALETEPHSGIFIGTLFPVAGEPTKPTEIKVGPTDEITVTYHDRENTEPGIPWDRTIKLEQAIFEQPELRIYEVTSQELTERQLEQGVERDKATTTLDDYVAPRRSMLLTRPVGPTDAATPTPVLVDSSLVVELIYPQLALTAESEAEIFVQSSRGRAKAGVTADDPFTVNVPGTLKIVAMPGDVPKLIPPPGYLDIIVRGDNKAREPLDDGRFTFVIPMTLNLLPPDTLVNWEPDENLTGQALEEARPKLAIQGDDTIFVGFKYTDSAGAEQWIVRQVELTSDIFFDVMDRKFQEDVTAAYVGETVYLRVIERTRDVSDDKDEVEVVITNRKGDSRTLKLAESFAHTGAFKGLMRLVYQEETEALDRPGVLPVDYGDLIALEYRDAAGNAIAAASLEVHRGADGDVQPFTKRYRDKETAVQTQFMVAEAYFELAKKHHTLGQESLARREMSQARRLLAEAIRDNPDGSVQAQAEYLLANLTYEYGDLSENETDKKDNYISAVAAFNDIVASYPDSPYAPKAQYKKGLVYEKMGQIDQACAEYVKLSYRYPDNELVAETIARLGQYFLTKGKEIKDEADSQTDPVQKEKLRRQYVDTFKTAASVFGRLSERFPDHTLSGKTIMLSAQCYMRAEDLPRSIEVFTKVYEDVELDKDLRSESMYWAGHCQMEMRRYEDAYKAFTKLTWDYPESRWAKFARGRLTDPNLNKLQLQ